jgi:hypothetical protein
MMVLVLDAGSPQLPVALQRWPRSEDLAGGAGPLAKLPAATQPELFA